MTKKNNLFTLQQKLDPVFQSQLKVNQILSRKQFIRVIICFKTKLCNKTLCDFNRKLGTRKISQFKRLSIIRGIQAKIPKSSLMPICKCNHVHKVFLDRKKKIHLNHATPSVGASYAQKNGWTGKNIGIAILDTGVFPHPDLTQPHNRIVAFKDFLKHKKNPYDDNGHGTHCAGDAAGNGVKSNETYVGPSPKAKIIGVKVLDKKGRGYDSNVIRGIEWCIQNKEKYGIRILVLSLGGTAELPYREDPVCKAITHAWKKGLIIVTSAGNEGPQAKTIDSPGICPEAITVGATNDQNQTKAEKNKVAPYSSRGPTIDGLEKPDIVAPGSHIVSLRSPDSYLDKHHKNKRVGKWYMKMSGTSMSAPIVAGVIAQILEKKPTLTPYEVKKCLQTKAINLGLNRNSQGSGLANNRFL